MILLKVIFLDVDGVLNTSETFDRVNDTYIRTGISELEIDEFRLEYLKTIIDKTGAKIILSSAFRRKFIKNNNKVIPKSKTGKEIYDLFAKYDIEIYDITPMTGNPINREEQIYAWLYDNNDVESFIIIDDEPNMFKELLDRLIKTSKVKDNEMLMNMDDCIGLCEEHIDIAIQMLNVKTKVLKK